MQLEPLLYFTVSLLLIFGFAFTGNLFNDTRGLEVSLGPPPIPLTAKALGSQGSLLTCQGPSVLSNSIDNVTIAVVPNQQVICTGTNVSSLTWAISPIPTFQEGIRKTKHHAFIVGNQNSPFFSTDVGMNLVNIHLGFETDDTDDLGKYEDIFVVSTVFNIGNIPANTAYISFQPTTTWTRTPGRMTQSATTTAGISLTALILGSLVLICTIIFYFRQPHGETYQTMS